MRRAIAFALLLTFGCSTVRVRTEPIEKTIPLQGATAELQIELWVESSGPVSEADAAAARAQAQSLLEEALRSRAIATAPLTAEDPLLLVRERGVSRTSSHRRDQTGAKVALVAGAVVFVVAAVAVALAASKNGSSGSSVANRSAPAARAAKPVARPKPAPVTPVARPKPPHPRARPVPSGSPPTTIVLAYPFRPVPYSGGNSGFWTEFDFQIGPELLLDRTANADATGSADAGAEAEPPPLDLPEQPGFDVSSRGFFSGDDSILQLSLLDRATGELLWTNTVRGRDPLDADDVRRLVNDAFQGASWVVDLRRP